MSDDRRQMAYSAGRAAGEAGQPTSVCQIPSGTIYYDDWHDGHSDGFLPKPLVGLKAEEQQEARL